MEDTKDKQIATTATIQNENSFENYRTDIVTTVSYLIGITDWNLENSKQNFNCDILQNLSKNDDAKIIRNLCLLRNQFFCNYKKIVDERNGGFKPLDQIDKLLSKESILFLREHSIEVASINKGSENITFNIAYINQYLLDNINKIRSLIPQWIKFDYIANLFLMPGCYSGPHGANLSTPSGQSSVKTKIHEIRGKYLKQKNLYPYHTYITRMS